MEIVELGQVRNSNTNNNVFSDVPGNVLDILEKQPQQLRLNNKEFDYTPYNKQLLKTTEQEVREYSWRKQINMQARVIGKKADMVLCECLLDPDERIFETRSFPKLLFENIPNLLEKPYVYISIKMKPGTTRIDVADGSKRVDKKLFEINSKWDELLKDNISEPLTKTLGYGNDNV